MGNAGDGGVRDAFDALTELVSQRLVLADRVAAAKFGTGQPIDDPLREQQLLDEVRESSPALSLDENLAVRFFGDQIEASKVVQRGLYEQWSAHPPLRPAEHPDLAAEVRPQLDRLNLRLLSTLKAVAERLGRDRDRRIEDRPAYQGFDELHRRALRLALRSVAGAAH